MDTLPTDIQHIIYVAGCDIKFDIKIKGIPLSEQRDGVHTYNIIISIEQSRMLLDFLGYSKGDIDSSVFKKIKQENITDDDNYKHEDTPHCSVAQTSNISHVIENTNQIHEEVSANSIVEVKEEKDEKYEKDEISDKWEESVDYNMDVSTDEEGTYTPDACWDSYNMDTTTDDDTSVTKKRVKFARKKSAGERNRAKKQLQNKRLDEPKSMNSKKSLTQTAKDSQIAYETCMRRMYISKTKSTTHMCAICGEFLKTAYRLYTHMSKHTGETRFHCPVCKKGFPFRSHLKVHMRTHSGELPFLCNVCGRKFSQKGQLLSHTKTHTNERPFPCTFCPARFKLKPALTRHIRVHTKEKPYKCSVCYRAFSLTSSLKVHMRVHTGDKPYKCTVCDYASAKCSGLQEHMMRHKGERPYKCSLCDYGAVAGSELKRHVRVKHGTGEVKK